MDLPDRIRAFIALRLSSEVDRAILELIAQTRAPDDGISWSRAASLHLTLRFLGDTVESTLIAPLAQALRRTADETAPFVVEVRGIGAFPNFARPRVVWAGLKGEELLALAGKVEAAVVQSGFRPERRPFSAHLTLGRVRNLARWRCVREKLEAVSTRDFGSSRIESMALYESRLSPEGAIHREIERFAFAARG